jgi:hypothetical protein
MARLGRVPGALDRRRMPIRIIPLVDRTLIAMAAATRPPVRQVLGLLRRPRLSDLVIRLFGRRLAPLAAMLRTTVSPTMVRGGAAINGV